LKRFLAIGALVVTTGTLASPAWALEVVSPPVLASAGLKEQFDAFSAATGAKVAVRTIELLKVPATAENAPTDMVFATSDLLEGMKNVIANGSIQKIGRVSICLAVRAGAPHPDISTTEKLVAALKSAKAVVYSNPDPARGSLGALMIDKLLKRPEFAGVHGVISTKGNGAFGLINGEGDMALQFESEILPHKELEVVAALPVDLGAYVDISAAIMAKAGDPAQAKAFAVFIARPEAAAIWKAHGLNPSHE
jgi:molybdate transport system substrate-binding protein